MRQNIIVTPSSKILNELGYEYLELIEDASEPEYTNIKFRDLVPKLNSLGGRAKEITDKALYKHQLEAIEALSQGKNIILISGTGSGKTEAWAIYALRNKLRVLAIYPTLALSQDQINRLIDYYKAIELRDSVIEIDRPIIEKLGGARKIIEKLPRALLVITNPAYLMADIKRIALDTYGKSKSILLNFLKNVDLIVLDELDYYGSKGATVLLILVEILQRYVCSKKPQLVILTATLGNPEELRKYLTRINGRETKIIRGKPFKVKNFTYLVLGKNIKKIWDIVQSNKDEIVKKIPEITQLIKDFNTFRDNVFNVVELLREYGFRIPELGLDIIEILAKYFESNENCVTVVFTPSIRSAEKLAKKLRSRLREGLGLNDEILGNIITTHHHLISADKRRRIEELAREGKIKIIFTVRTLLQGIDIGTIARIIHYGIPEDVREFKQREGRKGRRRDLPFSETLIIPIKPWDRRLVELGIDGLKEYISLPLENIYINPNNKYVLMFKALFKVKKYVSDLTNEEEELLKELGLVKPLKGLFGTILTLSDKGKEVWHKLNFYEYGPPYGISRILVNEYGKEVFIGDNISWCDLVEKYQPGCFDYLSDSIVIGIGRGVVIEQDIGIAIENKEFLREAYEQYYAVKMYWGEEPNILRDFDTGKLTSIVKCYIKVPTSGFGLFIEEPEYVVWEVESKRPKLVRFGDSYRMIYRSKHILLTPRVRGRYVDSTYGYVYELDPCEDIDKIRMGLAMLKIILRLSDYKLSFNELSYVVDDKPKKYMLIWESNCSGILESIDWKKIRNFVDIFRPSKICELLLWAVDEDIAVKVIEKNISWEEMKKYVHRVLDYIQGVLRLRLESLGEVLISRPSRDLKLLALDILPIIIDENTYYITTFFDGESYKHIVLSSSNRIKELMTIRTGDASKLFNIISNAVDRDFKILIYGQRDLLHKIARKSRTMQIILKSLKENNIIIDVHGVVREVLDVDIAPIEDLEKYLKIQLRRITLSQLRTSYHRAIVKKSSKELNELFKRAIEYSKANAYSTYIIYLILKQRA